jgi:succinate-semialdehyde dehydrogenase/glutarate-semialdehyde dehydrogenase
LDPDLLQIVHGAGDIGAAVVDQADVVSFTGGTDTGRKVAQAAASRLVPCSVELGGKNPMLVLDGANASGAAWGLITGAFYNAGQTCISIERAFVHESVWAEFVELAAARCNAIELGWSDGYEEAMGSLIARKHADSVEQAVTDAVAAGATVVAGGRRRRELGSAYFEPTLLTDVTPSMPIWDREVFGPVAFLQKVSSEEEAIALANDTPYGLNASVWTGSRRRSTRIARRLRAGTVGINSTLAIYNAFHAPMGGRGDSGFGHRYGNEGIRRFAHPQTAFSSPATAGGYESIIRAISTPDRARWLSRLFRLWARIPGLR